MTARVYAFRGTEADSDLPLIAHAYAACPEALSDEERALRDADWPTTRRYPRTLTGVDSAFPRDPSYAEPFERFTGASFAEQDRQVETLSHKWANRCLYLIGAGVLIAYLMGAFK